MSHHPVMQEMISSKFNKSELKRLVFHSTEQILSYRNRSIHLNVCVNMWSEAKCQGEHLPINTPKLPQWHNKKKSLWNKLSQLSSEVKRNSKICPKLPGLPLDWENMTMRTLFLEVSIHNSSYSCIKQMVSMKTESCTACLEFKNIIYAIFTHHVQEIYIWRYWEPKYRSGLPVTKKNLQME